MFPSLCFEVKARKQVFEVPVTSQDVASLQIKITSGYRLFFFLHIGDNMQQSNISQKKNAERFETATCVRSTMQFFAKILYKKFMAVVYFRKKILSQMFDWVLSTPLGNLVNLCIYSPCNMVWQIPKSILKACTISFNALNCISIFNCFNVF